MSAQWDCLPALGTAREDVDLLFGSGSSFNEDTTHGQSLTGCVRA